MNPQLGNSPLVTEKPTQPVLKIYGTRGSSACYNIRDFLHRSDVPFQWIDLTSDQQPRAEAHVSGLGDRRLLMTRL